MKGMQPTPVFLPGEVYGQRRLAGSVWGPTESDMTEGTLHSIAQHYVYSHCKFTSPVCKMNCLSVLSYMIQNSVGVVMYMLYVLLTLDVKNEKIM